MTNNTKPPRNARRIWRVADLPQDRDPAKFELRNDAGSGDYGIYFPKSKLRRLSNVGLAA